MYHICVCQRTERGWREVLVDVDEEQTEQLRFVLAPSPTPASSTLLQVSGPEPGWTRLNPNSLD